MAYGANAAYQKHKMQDFNTLDALDPIYQRGYGGLYEGALSVDMFMARNFLKREDPGRRPT